MATNKKQASTKAPPPPEKERRKRRTMSQNDMLSYWTEQGFLIATRKLYLGSITTDVEGSESCIDSAMAKKFEVAMTAFEYFDPGAPITIIMNSPGGDLYHSLAIYDRIMDSPCPVVIHATGYVMSGGSLILQAGDKRLLTRNSSVLLHYGSPSSNDDHHVNADRWAEENKRLRGIMEEIYLGQMIKKDPTVTREKVQQLLMFDTFMDPAKAIRLGLADGLTPRTKHKKPKVAQPQQAPQTPSA